MLKKTLIILILIIILLFNISLIKIDNNKTISIDKKILINNNDNSIGYLKINKINLKEKLYNINSKENNIEKNITILKGSILPDKDNSIIFIAAHSGTGKIAYFEELDELKEKDEIILNINNKTYKYLVKEYWEEKKNGYINVNKENKNQLILTTCSPNKKDYQLIINCIEKES